MSEEEKSQVTKEAKKTKWFSIISALIVFIKTIVDIFFN